MKTIYIQRTVFKEARAGFVLKNWLRDFFLIFAYVIFMVFRAYQCKKNHTSPWLYWNGGDLKIYVQYSLFCIKYIGKNASSPTKFGFKKKNELVKFKKIDKWYLYGNCLYLSTEKIGGHRWNIKEGLSQTLKICKIRGDLI